MKTTAIWEQKYARRLFAAAIASGLVAPAEAQQHIESSVPPVFQSVDENGVDQISGQMTQVMTSIGIGPGGPGSLTYNWANSNSAQTELFGFVQADTPTTGKYTVTIGGATETFTLTGTLGSGTFTQDQGRGSTLTYDSGTSRFTYTRTDGSVAILGGVGSGSPIYLISLTYPAGQSLTYYYRLIPVTPAYYQVRSVVSNLGYQLHYDYALAPSGTFYTQTGVVLFNRANEACDPTADTCTLTGNWPRLTFTNPSSTEVDATDNLGRLFRWINTQQAPQFGQPGTAGTSTLIFPTGRTLAYAIDQWGRVSSFSDGRGTWQYTHPNPFGGNTLTTYPEQNGPPRQVNFDTATGHILSEVQTHLTETLTTTYTWTSNRISAVAISGGPTTQYTYDSRGNVTETRRISATPGSPPDMVTSATYPGTCSNQRTCNQPTTTTDERGNVTEYTYDPNTGAVLTVKLPAGANGVRPQTVYGYTAFQAYYLNNAGSITASGSNVTLPTSISSCMTQAPGTCTGTADEARTTIAYGPQTAGTANNLLPVSTTARNGSGTLIATTAVTYTPNGDVETVDGPLAGSADTARTYYDAARRPTGAIGPDPDAGGALRRPASRTTYNGDNQPTMVETGIATDQSASGMATFSSLRQQVTGYDAQGRATDVRLNAGGTTYALTQANTTSSGLPDCSALRMNPATFASPPASACTPATVGSYGPDRISQVGYDWYRRLPVTVTTGVGTALAAVEATTGYDALNRVATLADGQGNLTTYEYDGLGRQVKVRYPSLTTPGQSSTTDYQQLTYATAMLGGTPVSTPLVSIARLRDNTNIAFSYDNLGRVILKDLPPSELDVAYGYDNLGRMTLAATSAQTLTFTFDALGRNLSQVGPHGTVSYAYDLAGRRTQMTYADSGLYVNYDYDAVGNLTRIRENGATSGIGVLASYAYDQLGRREAATYGNGTIAGYSHDAVGRTSVLAQNLSGTAADLSISFTYNPASQIAGVTRANDAYAWGLHYAVNRNYTTNALNQYTASGPITPTYDARGNLNSADGIAYAYSSENRLISATGGVTLGYDPLGRLYQTSGASTTRFGYDGANMIAEYNSSNALQRRYVFGPGTDEPLVWYEESTGTSIRHWFHADERGSIVATSDSSGAMSAINTYDEHGIPGASNSGRFQYTGQAWMPELGMYYYKARMYSPPLGRFMQTDPIGYGAGMNIYNYVGGDPVNLVDPNGLTSCPADARGPCPDDIIVTGARFDAERWRQVFGQNIADQLTRQIDFHAHNARNEPIEQYFGVRNGAVTRARLPTNQYQCGSTSAVGTDVSSLRGADAVIHIHSFRLAPFPGPSDFSVARGLQIPLYGISPDGIWRINVGPPIDAQLLAGNWGRDDLGGSFNEQAWERAANSPSTRSCTFVRQMDPGQ